MMRSSLLLVRRIASSIAPKQQQNLIPATATFSSLASANDPISITTSFKPAVAIIIPNSHLNQQQRSFSSKKKGKTSKTLGSILQREINEEEEAAEKNGELPPELAELHSVIGTNWTILEGIQGVGSGGETGSGASVRMFKKSPGSNGAKIGVVFHCQDSEKDFPFDESDYYNEDEEYEGEEPSQANRFGVTVSKGGKTVVLQCHCGADGDISVESVNVRDGETESVLAALAAGKEMNRALYQGPEFNELAEDLQESFKQYVVNECGIDKDVAAFISMYADYREQVEYVNWMKTAVDILD